MIPTRIGLGNFIHQRNHCIDDVIDIREVSFHFAMVVDIQRHPLKNGFGEFEQRHIGPAPGAIDGKETQACTRKFVKMCVAMSEHLVGFFGRRIQTHRVICRMSGRKRLLAI